MALYDTPPAIDPRTGRLPNYKQVMKVDQTTGVYKLKYEYTKPAPLTSADLVGGQTPAQVTQTKLTTPQTEFFTPSYTGGDGGDGGDTGGGDTGGNTGGGTGTSTSIVGNQDGGQGGGGDRNMNQTASFDIRQMSTQDLLAGLNPESAQNYIRKGIGLIAPTPVSLGLGVLSYFQKASYRRELERRAAEDELNLSAITTGLTNEQLLDLANIKDLSETIKTGIMDSMFVAKQDPMTGDAQVAESIYGQSPNLGVASGTIVQDPMTGDASIAENIFAEDRYQAALERSAQNLEQERGGIIQVSGPDITEKAKKFGQLKNSAIDEGNYSAAMSNSMLQSGYMGLSRDTAEKNKNKDFSAATANAGFGYEGETKTQFKGTSMESTQTGTYSERRAKEREGLNEDGSTAPGSVAEAREIAGQQEREPGTSVNTDDAVDNKARKNEVSDANGNVVTNTQTDEDGNKTTTAVVSNPANNKKLQEKQKDKNRSEKIVCTMMNESYGFGSFRNKIWLKHSKNLKPEYQIGYHKLFLPLVNYAKGNKLSNLIVKKILEHIARHRTLDIRQEMRNNKRHILGRVYRIILEPICYIVGKKEMKNGKR